MTPNHFLTLSKNMRVGSTPSQTTDPNSKRPFLALALGARYSWFWENSRRWNNCWTFSHCESVISNLLIARGGVMKLKVIIHEAKEGGYWGEVPAIPGCATQGDTFDELLSNLYEAVEGCLSVDVQNIEVSPKDKVMEIAV